MYRKIYILWLGLLLSGFSFAQNAFYLPEFASEFDLKSEATLKIGPAIPTASFKSCIGETGIVQGANTGFVADLSYNYYFIPYFGLGLGLGGEWFGYNFDKALGSQDYEGKLIKNGWNMYSIGLSLNVRIPIVRKLYLIGQVQGRFGLLSSPSAKSVEIIDIFDENGKKIDKKRNVTTLLRTDFRAGFILGGELGIQYRVIKNILVQATCQYRYFVNANSADSQRVNLMNAQSLEYRYSAFTINLGVSYAF